MNLVTPPGHIVGGQLHLKGIDEDLFELSEDEWEHVRGKHLGLVAQGSQNIFNPIMRFDEQFADMFAAHKLSVADGMDHARGLLKDARLPVDRVLRAYPHELSGGMRQRVSIVSSLMVNPDVLILDEPTTALDVMSQAIVLDSLKQLKEQQSTAVIFISHDVAVVSSLCDKIAVMYAGRFVEIGPVADIYFHPRHPYTDALVKAVPSLDGDAEELVSIAGQPPDLAHMPPGCAFAPRCPVVMPQCHTVTPEFIAVGDGGVACHRYPSETGVSAYA
jgi:peptide/nickel transport system ATP-binding protein